MSGRKLDSALIATVSDILSEKGDRARHNSPSRPLIDYFSRRCERLTVLELSMPRPGMVFRPQAVRYERGSYVGMHVWPDSWTRPFALPPDKIGPRTYLRLKLRDIFACVWAARLYPEKYDLFIGVECLLALVGALLKRGGKVSETVYYISDWSPWKYAQRLVNDLYLRLDHAACRQSDFIWNFTYAISDARRDILKYDMSRLGRELWVPYGFIPDGVTIAPDRDVDRRRLVFSGGICRENGLALVIEALPAVLEKIPDVVIDIFGDGPELSALKARAEELKVSEALVWHGYVTDRDRILKAMYAASASLAPYMPFPENVKRFGDVIKIREAIGCGVPIITTEVPPSHREVREKGLGAVIDYDPAILAETIIGLLTDDEAYFAMRARVRAASRDNLWESIYDRTLAAMDYDPAARHEPSEAFPETP